MRFFVLTVCMTLTTLSSARPQHKQVDPAYLRQYYAQIAQGAGQGAQAAPIYEQQEVHSAGQQRQYVQERQYQQQPQQPQQIQYVQQPQPQPQQYRAPHLQQQKQAPRPRPVQHQQQKEDSEEYDVPSNYQFGFDVKDDEFTNYQNRKETSDNGVIKGSYSVVDSDGFIRTVTYTADPKEGFKAEVVREPTDIVIKMPKPAEEQKGVRNQPQQYIQASPASRYQQPQQQQQHQQQRPEYHYQQQ